MAAELLSKRQNSWWRGTDWWSLSKESWSPYCTVASENDLSLCRKFTDHMFNTSFCLWNFHHKFRIIQFILTVCVCVLSAPVLNMILVCLVSFQKILESGTTMQGSHILLRYSLCSAIKLPGFQVLGSLDSGITSVASLFCASVVIICQISEWMLSN